MHDALQRLLDQAAIRDVHLRYCRGIDRMDFDLVRACYHPDAIDDHGSYVGGIDGFIAWAKQLLAQYESTTHLTGNQLIEVQGDEAWAEHYARAYHRRSAIAGSLPMDFVVNVRYVDRMERREGEWRIAHRVITVDSDRADPVFGLYAGKELKRSRRDRDDPSYQGLPEVSRALV